MELVKIHSLLLQRTPNLALQPGLAIFSGPLYSRQSSFTIVTLPSITLGNPSAPLVAQSITLSSTVWAAFNSSNNNPFIVWDSIPDVSQLPDRKVHFPHRDRAPIFRLQPQLCSGPNVNPVRQIAQLEPVMMVLAVRGFVHNPQSPTILPIVIVSMKCVAPTDNVHAMLDSRRPVMEPHVLHVRLVSS
jgi:hypothetical protein